jgi:hypothetical protein
VDDINSRLEQYERVLLEWRTLVRAAGGNGGAADPSGARVQATLTRIQRLTEILRSSSHRREPDALDRVTMQLLLEDYSEIVRGLRASANEAASRLGNVADLIADESVRQRDV